MRCVHSDFCSGRQLSAKELTNARKISGGKKPHEVVADACGLGIGAGLLQNDRRIAFESPAVTCAECNYHIGEQELLAVLHAIQTWRF